MATAPRTDLEHFHTLTEAVHHVATHDEALEQFGARVHRYAFGEKLTKERVAEIEREHGCKLPADYAGFLTRVGGHGAGPYYGLLPLDVPSQLASLDEDFAYTERVAAEDLPENERARFMSDAAVKGTITLAHAGCCYFAILVVRGRARGQVWLDFRGAEGPLLPTPDTFQNYYARWLGKLTDGEVVPLGVPPKTCGLPQVLDNVVAEFEVENGLAPGSAKEEHIHQALGAIPEGAIALRSSGPEMARYFNEEDPVDPCPSCVALVTTLVDSGAMRWTQVAPGGPPRAARGE